MAVTQEREASATTNAGHGLAQRVLDLTIAIPVVLLAAPLMALVALAIRIDSPGPALFRQPRAGRWRRDYTIVKFRTMFVDNDDSVFRIQNELEIAGLVEPMEGVAYKDADDPRVTRVGRVLRRFSIDELPQLLNVVRGQMSIVGPRPSLVWEAELFPDSADDRFSVRPGITGVWQVSGRNNVSMVEMVEMDCGYARSRTVLGDLAIILRTIPAVFDADGAA